MSKRDYSEVLGVARNASEEQLTTAYRRLAMKHHPARNQAGDKEAEAAFKRTTTKVAEAPPKVPRLPGVRELVSLRIDQDVLEYFQEGGPGWQDRMNEALRKAAGK